MGKTKIQWTEHSINPIRARHKPTGKIGHYCEKIASGCTNCYSSAMQRRFGTPPFGSGQLRDDFEIFLDESRLQQVRKRKKPTTYFWCDMTDIFGSWMTRELINPCFEVMDETPWHTHQLLTKRPENILKMWPGHEYKPLVEHPAFNDPSDYHRVNKFRENVWLGCSASDQKTADETAPHLVGCWQISPVLFLSYEPILGPIDWSAGPSKASEDHRWWPAEFDMLICGGESGPHARPCEVDWIRDAVRLCKQWDIATFVKQLGANIIDRRSTVAHSCPESECWPEGFRQEGQRIHARY